MPTDRSFGLTFAVIFVVVSAWLLWRDRSYWPLTLGVAALFLLAALTYPRVLHRMNAVWMHFGLALNRIVSPIVMGAIFFGLLTPVALLLRLRGRDVLQRRFDPARQSYWLKREPPGPDGSSFPRQY
jgi:predicted membrane metal-binding protein